MRKGFTLIELLIVIMVIAILIGIALPRFRGMQEEGNIAKAKGELVTLQAAVESYYMHNNNAYPVALTNLTTATPQIVSTTLPKDPFVAVLTDYGYAQSPDARYYVIYSVGTGGNGGASVANTGVITETNATSCIYVSNAGRDTQP
jgi:general secretion pathway protein G